MQVFNVFVVFASHSEGLRGVREIVYINETEERFNQACIVFKPAWER